MSAGSFDPQAQADFDRLLRWRRDMRHFTPEPVADAVVQSLLAQACLAPSVGNAQPWRFVLVQDLTLRQAIQADFEQARSEAEASIPLEKLGAYRRAKLEGFQQAPVHIAAFTDGETERGLHLGRHSMPECLDYSTVMAVHTLWLAARVQGLGLGWVSILDPASVARILSVPSHWRFTAYLCLGHPAYSAETPELEAVGWQGREAPQGFIHRR